MGADAPTLPISTTIADWLSARRLANGDLDVPKNRSRIDKMALPGTSGKFILDTYRGQYRMRSWPKKRGTPTDPVQLSRIQRFADANRLAKFVNGNFWALAHRVTKGSGLYPRDVLVQAMLAGQYDIALANGDLISYKEFFLEKAVFQGCTVQRTSGQVIGAGAETTITWQTPIIQTVPIWNPATPTRLVVPTGVNIVRLSASTRSVASVTTPHFIIIRNQAAALLAAQSVGYTGSVNLTVITAPIYVTPGDWFDCRVFWGGAGTLQAVVQTNFAMEILNTP